MDYSQLSDFEINKRVAICCGFAPEDCEIAKLGTSIVGVEWDDRTGYAIKRLITVKAQQTHGRLSLKSNISIILDNPSMPCATDNARDLFDDAGPNVGVAYDNPLRAAMIVFLMMQDANNA